MRACWEAMCPDLRHHDSEDYVLSLRFHVRLIKDMMNCIFLLTVDRFWLHGHSLWLRYTYIRAES